MLSAFPFHVKQSITKQKKTTEGTTERDIEIIHSTNINLSSYHMFLHECTYVSKGEHTYSLCHRFSYGLSAYNGQWELL